MPETNINIQVQLAQLLGKVQQTVNANRENQQEKSKDEAQKGKIETKVETTLAVVGPSLGNAYAKSKIASRRPAAYVQPFNPGLAPLVVLFDNTGIKPPIPEGSTTLFNFTPLPPAPEGPDYGSGEVIPGDNATNVRSETDERYLILPYKNDIGIFVRIKDTAWGSALWRRGIYALTTTHPEEFLEGIPAGLDIGNERWSWCSTDAYREQIVDELTGEVYFDNYIDYPAPEIREPDLIPYTNPITFENKREVKCYLYATALIEQKTIPSDLANTLNTIFPSRNIYDQGGVKSFIVTADFGWTETNQFDGTIIRRKTEPTFAQIIASSFVLGPEITLNPVTPWKGEDRGLTGYGIQQIYSSARGWGSAVYSYLDGLFPINPTGTLLEDVRNYLIPLGLNHAWIHQFNEPGYRDIFYQLAGILPTGLIGNVSDTIQGRTRYDTPYPPDDVTNPWQKIVLKTNPQIVYDLVDENAMPWTDIAYNRFPVYNLQKLLELGFTIEDLQFTPPP